MGGPRPGRRQQAGQRGQRTSAATKSPPPASAGSVAGGPASSSSSNGSRFSWAGSALLSSAAAALFAGMAHAQTTQQQLELEAGHARAAKSLKEAQHWIAQIESQPGIVKAMDAEMLLEENHPILEDDHMFAAFVSKGIVDDLTGYYSSQEKKFYAVVSLGREVCGFPKIVHGGLTAAIIDESFGGLLFALKQAKALSFWGPAYTVQLEVSYKAKISAGRTVLCTTEVESMNGRKLWMKATVSDGPDGQVYATARALFVAPKPHKMVQDVGKYLLRRMFGDI